MKSPNYPRIEQAPDSRKEITIDVNKAKKWGKIGAAIALAGGATFGFLESQENKASYENPTGIATGETCLTIEENANLRPNPKDGQLLTWEASMNARQTTERMVVCLPDGEEVQLKREPEIEGRKDWYGVPRSALDEDLLPDFNEFAATETEDYVWVNQQMASLGDNSQEPMNE